MQGLSLAIWLALHICFWNPGSARTAYWTEWAILPSSQINKEYLLLSLVFPGIFQRPLHIHYTPFLTAAPHQSLRLLKMPCSQGFLCQLTLETVTGPEHRATLVVINSVYKSSACFSPEISERSTQQSSVCSPDQHGQNWVVQPLRGSSQILWTPKHIAEQPSAKIHNRMQKATSMGPNQTKAHLQNSSCAKLSLRTNDTSLYLRLNPRLRCKHLWQWKLLKLGSGSRVVARICV